LALLFEDQDNLSAAAHACDQQPHGDRYWAELHPHDIRFRSGMETAHACVEDKELVDRLLRMEFSDGFEAAETLDNYLASNSR